MHDEKVVVFKVCFPSTFFIAVNAVATSLDIYFFKILVKDFCKDVLVSTSLHKLSC